MLTVGRTRHGGPLEQVNYPLLFAGQLLRFDLEPRELLVAAGEHDIHPIPVDQLVPEAGQGAVVVQAQAQACARTGFDWTAIDHVDTRRGVQLERRIARLLGGGCERPVGVHVELAHGRIHAFHAPTVDGVGIRIDRELVGLELGTLVSVSAPRDVDDAAEWTAAQVTPALAAELGAPGSGAAR